MSRLRVADRTMPSSHVDKDKDKSSAADVDAKLKRPDWALVIPDPPKPTGELRFSYVFYEYNHKWMSKAQHCPRCKEKQDCIDDGLTTCVGCGRQFGGPFYQIREKIERLIDRNPDSIMWGNAVEKEFSAMGNRALFKVLAQSPAYKLPVSRRQQPPTSEPLPPLRKLPWTAQVSIYGLRYLAISSAEISAELDSLTKVIKHVGSLRALGLGGSDLFRNPPSTALMEQFGASFRTSNVQVLDLSKTAVKVSSGSAAVSAALTALGVFLENLNSKSLDMLNLSDCLGATSFNQEQLDRYEVMIARFIRRSTYTATHIHPAVLFDPSQYGAPNLTSLHVDQQGLDSTAYRILGVSLIGSGEVRWRANAFLDPPKPARHSEDSSEDEGTNEDSAEYQDDDFNSSRIRRRHRQLDREENETFASNPLAPNRALVQLSLGTIPYSNYIYGSSYDHSRASASWLLGIFRATQKEGAIVPDWVSNEVTKLTQAFTKLVQYHEQAYTVSEYVQGRLRANEHNRHDLKMAAFSVLRAARVLGCQVSGPLDETAQNGWLSMPAEVCSNIIRYCDYDNKLTDTQYQRVLSFACDRRTIGFGLKNEVYLYDLRLEEEVQRSKELKKKAIKEGKRPRSLAGASGKTNLKAQPWSWKAALQFAWPTDWTRSLRDSTHSVPRNLIEHKHRKTLNSDQQAMLAVTGCNVARRDDVR